MIVLTEKQQRTANQKRYIRVDEIPPDTRLAGDTKEYGNVCSYHNNNNIEAKNHWLKIG